jgi:hypothetical protein
MRRPATEKYEDVACSKACFYNCLARYPDQSAAESRNTSVSVFGDFPRTLKDIGGFDGVKID